MSESVFVCAHGAGGHKDDRSMLRFANAFPPGVEVVRFDFPYREEGSKRPDPMRVLQDAIREVAERNRKARLFLGGRSMGGRAASMLVADGYSCDGLILAAYPLHPAGQVEKPRAAHLVAIEVPVLCINGTRDPLCTKELMDRAVGGLSNWHMHWLEGADHSFHVLKSSGRTDADIDAEVAVAVRRGLETRPHPS
ncbi:MAG: alpha/beta hydrolase family protein [Betaproteobacteria bacterium]